MTEYQKVFSSFLNKIRKDMDFFKYSDEELEEDMIGIMNNSIPMFKFPRENLLQKDDDGEFFEDDLKIDTINVLTNYMLYNWYVRKAANSDSTDQRIVSKDLVFYSQANHIEALRKSAEQAYLNAKKSENTYYRSNNHNPQIIGLVGDER